MLNIVIFGAPGGFRTLLKQFHTYRRGFRR